jgi:hypothetical protein
MKLFNFHKFFTEIGNYSIRQQSFEETTIFLGS